MTSFDGFSVPIFIICRDKLSQLALLVDWLESNNYKRIFLIDNASTYPPLLEYLEEIRTRHTVVRYDENLGPYRSVWGCGIPQRYAAGEHYVVTDSDLVPDIECPPDAIDYFHYVLRRYPDYLKAGFALRIDDLPSRYVLSDDVKEWEAQYWRRPLERGLYHAAIDTTFALYRPDAEFDYGPSIRTGRPYWARHLPWYSDSSRLTEEEEYYRAHAMRGIAHWDLSGQHKGDALTREPLYKRWAKSPPVVGLTWPLYAACTVRRNRDVTWSARGTK